MIVTRLIPAVVFVAIFVAHALYVGRVCGLSPFRLDGLRHQRPCRRAAGPGGLLARTGLFLRFFLCVDCGVRHVGAQSQHPLSSRKNRFGGSRCRRGDAFGSAHGRRLLSDRLLWITDASRLPEPVRRAKALGLGKPLMALVTLISVSCGYWCLSRHFARRNTCMDDCCPPAGTLQESRQNRSIRNR